MARIPKSGTNYEPKQPVRGAERLATPDSQGLHHRSLLGPSLQQGWAEEAADGQLIWVDGSVEEMAHRADSTVQQKCFKIPRDFKTGYQALLVATPADWANGTVREIKCRLCPDAEFKMWGKFKRHCENRPAECLQVMPEQADAKRRATQTKHDEFVGRLEGYLTTREEDIGMSFSKTIKDMYPGSSKKRIRGSRE